MAASSSRPARVIPRATEMRAVGVTFVRRRPARDGYDVAFDGRRGVMEIPPVVIDGAKRPLLVNLIAFEQSQGVEETPVIPSYVSLMGMLVRGAEDVELLRRRGILENMLSDDEEAARFFSRLGEGARRHELRAARLRRAVRGRAEILRVVVAQEQGGASISAARGRPFPSSSPPSSLRSRPRRPTSPCFPAAGRDFSIVSVVAEGTIERKNG